MENIDIMNNWFGDTKREMYECFWNWDRACVAHLRHQKGQNEVFTNEFLQRQKENVSELTLMQESHPLITF